MSTRVEDLQAAADLMWDSMSECLPDKRAPLMAQWRALSAEVAAIADDTKVGDPVDEIAQRRASRGAGPAASPSHTRARSS
jgi:hypothetical protein